MAITIHKRSFILFIELYLIVQFDLLESIPVLSTAGNVLRVLFLIYELLMLSQRSLGDIKTSLGVKVAIGTGLFALYQSVVSFLFRSVPSAYIVNYFVQIALLLVCMENNCRYSFPKTMQTIRAFFIFTFVLNFITILIFRHGITQTISATGNPHENYLLGVDNQFGKIFFPGFVIIWFVDSLKSNKKLQFTTVFILMTIVLSYLIKFNGTGMVLSVVLLLLFVCYYTPVLNRFVSFKFLFVILVVLVVGIFTQSGLLYQNSTVMAFVTRLIGKKTTLSGRVYIWASAVSKFFQKPVFGIGLSLGNRAVIYRNRLYAAHNLVLQILIDGGVIGLMLFLTPILSCFRSAERFVLQEKRVRIFYIGFFLTFLYSLMEVGNIISLCIMTLLLSHYIDTLRNSEGQETDVSKNRLKKEFSV